MKLPEYLAKTGYKCPDSATDGPFQYAHDTKLESIEWKKQRPPIIQSFANHMSGYRQGRPSWMDEDFYPVQEGLGRGFKTEMDAVMLVDVGGSIGHDLIELKAKHPQLPGRLILQDLPHIIEKAPELEGIEVMEHDFYTPQPIKGKSSESR